MLYLIAYDIVEDSKRNGICKYLSGWGRRVQKSVFECDVDREELQSIISYIREMINLKQDRCHIYRICAECVSYKRSFGQDLEPAPGQVIIV